MKTSALAFDDQIAQMIADSVSLVERVRLECALAKRLIERGDYEGARRALVERWMRVGDHPQLEGLENETKALLLLRCGALTGYLGSAYQISNAQEIAKDLITASGGMFELLGLTLDYIETQYELMLCYWRTGESNEARVVAMSALQMLDHSQLDDARSNSLKANLLIRTAIVESRLLRFDESLKLLDAASLIVSASDDSLLKGRFHAERGTTFRGSAGRDFLSPAERLVILESARQEFSHAIQYFELGGHVRYAARIQNNLGMTYLTMKNYPEAHLHFDAALNTFMRLKDAGSSAMVRESIARVFLAEGKYDEAIRIAEQAIRVLMGGDESAMLSEALTTYATARARKGLIAQGHSTFIRAADVAELAGNSENAGFALITLIEELHAHLSVAQLAEAYERADRLLFQTTNLEAVRRLRECAARLVARAKSPVDLHTTDDGQSHIRSMNHDDLPFDEAMWRFEAGVLRRALEASDYKISAAAKHLGMMHQRLSAMLKTRHKELMPKTKLRKKRQKSLIASDMRSKIRRSYRRKKDIS